MMTPKFRHIGLCLATLMAASQAKAESFKITNDVLKDKIRGGWAGQVIGCTYGGPTEFRFQGTMIQDYVPIPWSEMSIRSAFENSPGLFDDVYMDMTFVEVLEKEGLRAPAALFARAFAGAPYPLWHANQMARWNIRHGVMPPRSGAWLRNPHADDIDFQIEADFAGLMAPGLVGAACEIADRVGHIMNSGDGWYGGVYVAAMYSLAFTSGDIEAVASGALGAIPAGSRFASVMRDVLEAHRRNPQDWKEAWFRVQKKWAEDVGCPEGVFSSFDIDAKVNAAWVLTGLLFGDGDFGRTLDISARCGDDSDCNPATAGGILGTILGYEAIPEGWRKGLEAVESAKFPYTNLSLREAAGLSFKHALELVRRNGGRVGPDGMEITIPKIRPIRLEQNFAGLAPSEKRRFGTELAPGLTFEFDGTGFAVDGEARRSGRRDYVFRVEIALDGRKREVVELSTDFQERRTPLAWAYGLKPGRHEVRLRVLNPVEEAGVYLNSAVLYKKQ